MMSNDEPNRGDDLVTLVTKSNEVEAATVVAVLKERGIEAVMFDALHGMWPLSARFPGVPVQVRRRDLERAAAALQKNIEDSVDLDWDEVEVGEREDQLPLGGSATMRFIYRIGFVLALAAAATFVAQALALGWIGLAVVLALAIVLWRAMRALPRKDSRTGAEVSPRAARERIPE